MPERLHFTKPASHAIKTVLRWLNERNPRKVYTRVLYFSGPSTVCFKLRNEDGIRVKAEARIARSRLKGLTAREVLELVETELAINALIRSNG